MDNSSGLETGASMRQSAGVMSQSLLPVLAGSGAGGRATFSVGWPAGGISRMLLCCAWSRLSGHMEVACRNFWYFCKHTARSSCQQGERRGNVVRGLSRTGYKRNTLWFFNLRACS